MVQCYGSAGAVLQCRTVLHYTVHFAVSQASRLEACCLLGSTFLHLQLIQESSWGDLAHVLRGALHMCAGYKGRIIRL